jgi:hypothetical protein
VVRINSIATMHAPAKPIWHHKSVIALFQIALQLLTDLLALTALAFRQRRATAAEILVLRRQLALYQERGLKPENPMQFGPHPSLVGYIMNIRWRRPTCD